MKKSINVEATLVDECLAMAMYRKIDGVLEVSGM